MEKVTIYNADVMVGLAQIPSGSIQCVMTSPPYMGLRDYQTAKWSGGDPNCDHRPGSESRVGRSGLEGGKATSGHQQEGYGHVCGKCGAVRVDHQIGTEGSPDAYIESLLMVFREVRRVLRPDGIVWLNLGDSYAGSGKGLMADGSQRCGAKQETNKGSVTGQARKIPLSGYLKPKDLMCIPWETAIALRNDGWWLRAGIPWIKKNAMPDSVRDRPTVSNEYIFLLSKSRKYFYDKYAALSPLAYPGTADGSRVFGGANKHGANAIQQRTTGGVYKNELKGRNRRTSDWWLESLQGIIDSGGILIADDGEPLGFSVNTSPYKGPHFAAFPPKLVEPCLALGTSEMGRCPICGAPWKRVVSKDWQKYPNGLGIGTETKDLQQHRRGKTSAFRTGGGTVASTVDWKPTCKHDAEPIPCLVLDPFSGSGTTMMVAANLGLDSIGIELSEEYSRLSEERIVNGCDNPVDVSIVVPEND